MPSGVVSKLLRRHSWGSPHRKSANSFRAPLSAADQAERRRKGLTLLRARSQKSTDGGGASGGGAATAASPKSKASPLGPIQAGVYRSMDTDADPDEVWDSLPESEKKNWETDNPNLGPWWYQPKLDGDLDNLGKQGKRYESEEEYYQDMRLDPEKDLGAAIAKDWEEEKELEQLWRRPELHVSGDPLIGEELEEDTQWSLYNWKRLHQFNSEIQAWGFLREGGPPHERDEDYHWGSMGLKRGGNPLCGYTPNRPIRESDMASPSVPLGWKTFVCVCIDKQDPDSKLKWFDNVRSRLWTDHATWARLSIRRHNATAKVLFDYAIYDPSWEYSKGNVIGVAAPTLFHAKKFLAENPYALHKLYAHMHLYEFDDMTKHHFMLGGLPKGPQFLIYGQDRDSEKAQAAAEELEEVHLRFATRSCNTIKMMKLMQPREDDEEELNRPVKQVIPFDDRFLLEDDLKKQMVKAKGQAGESEEERDE
uniref:Uncharacterized protein n=1 Tax=Chromera velia CCMP2878 TaxID=1169474 RepID=A0A0G4I7F1_9ALVE|eukprot:Cvel_11604.t1-p1 / transcript=Cvel_11604.t1 / gene=Cvel_11604 / organism=Chromera_velia_CCMP2878 / gene_product=hypothetical protein / transcript_product=hypothetical protein / location=Cvel_scaffold734:50140-54979(+) / protein_length=478 / sequence_SO=supercontig / SO=protein_coding / is_pseudo=false